MAGVPRLLLACGIALIVGEVWGADPPKLDPAQVTFFENKVRPVLAEHCYGCHGAKKQQAGLRLDTATGVRKGADSGPVVMPGQPDKSKLIHVIKSDGDNAMPPNKPMPKPAIEVLVSWVQMGAPFPDANTEAKPTNNVKDHWAFQPVKDPKPAIDKPNPIDGFILAKLREQGLKASPKADKRTLIRRAYFDLLGLPPTAEQIESFEKDATPQAFEKLIDTLLKSEHFGERWARHWLDIARYADSKGYVFTEDRNYPYAYTFRDYVIRAYNQDKPYTQFIIEQLAADKLPLGEDKTSLAAMGFLTVGRRFSNNIHDIIDDRIDVVTRGFLGVTMQCARCHDHKYDPVPIVDYYTIYGIFQNSPESKDNYPLIGTVERTPEFLKFEAELKQREAAVEEYRQTQLAKRTNGFGAVLGMSIPFSRNPERVLNRADRDAIGKLQKRVDQLKAGSPFNPPRAMTLSDAPNPGGNRVFLRGNPGNQGPIVPRQIPISITWDQNVPIKAGSGRLELAQAIANPKNPLTARVAVNRIWGQLLGQPIVRTPGDFGLRSEAPTHPELLDWLATRFMQDGWSTKKLIKRIMLSEAYQQSSNIDSQSQVKDPENRSLSHMNRRRLDFEAMRDSMLAVSGQLNTKIYGRSIDLLAKPQPTRRTVYASIDRQNLPGLFRVFDFPNPDQLASGRVVTTVPQQALYLMNSTFVVDQAKAIVERSKLNIQPSNDAERINRLYLGILARKPTAQELTLAGNYLKESQTSSRRAGELEPIEQLAQVLLLCNEFAFID